jgi:opacity protein-like surface antigen
MTKSLTAQTIQPFFFLTLALASTGASAEAPSLAGPSFGIHGGYGLSDVLDLRTRAVPTAVFKDLQGANEHVRTDDAYDLEGGLVGAQGQYLFRAGTWLWGGELAWSYTDLTETVYDDVACANANLCATDDQFESELSSVILLSGMAGRMWGRHFLHVKGGLALGDYELSIRDDNLNTLGQQSSGLNTGGSNDSQWLTGFSVGVGDRVSLDQHLSIGIGYQFVHFGDADLDTRGSGFCHPTTTSPLCTGRLGQTVAGDYPLSLDTTDVHLFKAEIHYRF